MITSAHMVKIVVLFVGGSIASCSMVVADPPEPVDGAAALRADYGEVEAGDRCLSVDRPAWCGSASVRGYRCEGDDVPAEPGCANVAPHDPRWCC